MGLTAARRRLHTLLGVTVAGLIAWVWLDSQDAAEQYAPLTTIDSTTLSELSVRRTARPSITLRRNPDSWHLTTPDQLQASPAQLEDLLAVLQAPVIASYALVDVDRAELELDQPLAELVAAGVQILFGARGRPEGYRYVVVGDQVHLISDRHYDTVAAPLADFVGTKPLPRGDLARIEWADELTLVHSDDGARWLLVGATEVFDGDRLAAAWQSLRARSVHPLDPATAPGTAMRVWLRARPEPLEYELITTANGAPLLLRRDLSLLYLLDDDAAGTLLPADTD